MQKNLVHINNVNAVANSATPFIGVYSFDMWQDSYCIDGNSRYFVNKKNSNDCEMM